MVKILKKLVGVKPRKRSPLKDDYDDVDAIEKELENELDPPAQTDARRQAGEVVNEETSEDEADWIDEDYEEGQLSIDVYQTSGAIIVKSTIAGVKPEDIDISINNDMLTIRGMRQEQETIKEDDYLYKECYWGSFSRSIILPMEVEGDRIEAFLENGVLTIVLPKSKSAKQINIKVREKH